MKDAAKTAGVNTVRAAGQAVGAVGNVSEAVGKTTISASNVLEGASNTTKSASNVLEGASNVFKSAGDYFSSALYRKRDMKDALAEVKNEHAVRMLKEKLNREYEKKYGKGSGTNNISEPNNIITRHQSVS